MYKICLEYEELDSKSYLGLAPSIPLNFRVDSFNELWGIARCIGDIYTIDCIWVNGVKSDRYPSYEGLKRFFNA